MINEKQIDKIIERMKKLEAIEKSARAVFQSEVFKKAPFVDYSEAWCSLGDALTELDMD